MVGVGVLTGGLCQLIQQLTQWREEERSRGWEGEGGRRAKWDREREREGERVTVSQPTTLGNGGSELSNVCPQVSIAETHHHHLRQQLQCHLGQPASIAKPGV